MELGQFRTLWILFFVYRVKHYSSNAISSVFLSFNASALGANRFNKMYSDLEKIVAKEETLEVLKG